MTEKQKFIEYLEQQGFRACEGNVLIIRTEIARCYKASDGSVMLPRDTHVCMFDGVDTKDGDLGCVTFCRNGSIRNKHCRMIHDGMSLFKVAVCPEDAEDAISEFELWSNMTASEISDYKRIA
jgi:hypothetical protein